MGLGCNNFGMRIDADRSREVVHAALDAGIDFFDTADVYGATRSEEFLGRALAGRRDEAVVATKFGSPLGEGRGGASAAWVAQACEDSLRRLDTDRIDLYQLHQPDPDVPIEETLGALDELVRAGKVREIGNSNFTAAQIDEAADVAAAKGWATVRHRAEPLQPAGPAAPGRGGARVRAPRPRHAAVLPPGQRAAHRQVPPGRGRTRGHPPVAHARGRGSTGC